MTLEENIFLAKRNLVDTIWKQANLEGVNVTFPETQMIIDGYSIANKTIEEITIVLNLKRAWQFLFDSIEETTTLNSIQDFNRIIGRDLVYKSGFLRTADVRISGTNYKPALPIDYEVRQNLDKFLNNKDKKEVALDIMLYIMRSQLFFDGNKRTAMLIANKILIQNGLGILAVSQEKMNDFFTKLIHFYETNKNGEIKKFCKNCCIETMQINNTQSQIYDPNSSSALDSIKAEELAKTQSEATKDDNIQNAQTNTKHRIK